MNVCLVTCFYARSAKVERILRFFLDQDYKGTLTLLLYNNAPYPQSVLLNEELPENKKIKGVHNYLDLQTGGQYTSTGDIFRDALTFVPENTDVITFFDSDDVFLPNHTTEGVKGMIRAHHLLKRAYKPSHSYFLWAKECQLARNTMEPSVFVDYQHVKTEGFKATSATYHDGWLHKLREENLLLDDPNGAPTLCYDWSEGHNTFKISGSGSDGPENLKNHREKEEDFGNGALIPISKEDAQKYYDLVKKPIDV